MFLVCRILTMPITNFYLRQLYYHAALTLATSSQFPVEQTLDADFVGQPFSIWRKGINSAVCCVHFLYGVRISSNVNGIICLVMLPLLNTEGFSHFQEHHMRKRLTHGAIPVLIPHSPPLIPHSSEAIPGSRSLLCLTASTMHFKDKKDKVKGSAI